MIALASGADLYIALGILLPATIALFLGAKRERDL